PSAMCWRWVFAAASSTRRSSCPRVRSSRKGHCRRQHLVESDLQIVCTEAEAVSSKRSIGVERPACHAGEIEPGLDSRIACMNHESLSIVLPDCYVLNGAPGNKVGRNPAIPNSFPCDGDHRAVGRECFPYCEQRASPEDDYPGIAAELGKAARLNFGKRTKGNCRRKRRHEDTQYREAQELDWRSFNLNRAACINRHLQRSILSSGIKASQGTSH